MSSPHLSAAEIWHIVLVLVAFAVIMAIWSFRGPGWGLVAFVFYVSARLVTGAWQRRRSR